jgi:hypothetical protein
MRLAKCVPDEELNLLIPKMIAMISIGIQEEWPTVLAVVAEEGEMQGKDVRFYFKIVGDQVTLGETSPRQFVTALMGKETEFFMYKEPTSILTPEHAPGPMPPGMAPPGTL